MQQIVDVPDNLTWDDFTARQAARETGGEDGSIPSPPRKKESSLSAVLLEAIHLAGARRGRTSRAERIREQTLLEVLSETMRRRPWRTPRSAGQKG
jgi:hypothetical protein